MKNFNNKEYIVKKNIIGDVPWTTFRKKEIDLLLESVSKKFSLTKEEILSKSRKKELIAARRIIVNVLFESFEKDNMSHRSVAGVINKDRTTFIHHRTEHLNQCDSYKLYKQEYNNFYKEYQEDLKKLN